VKLARAFPWYSMQAQLLWLKLPFVPDTSLDALVPDAAWSPNPLDVSVFV
jgi:hypothetical protein